MKTKREPRPPVEPNCQGCHVLYLCIMGADYVIEQERRFLWPGEAERWQAWYLRRKDVAPHIPGATVYSEVLICRTGEIMDYSDMRSWVRQNDLLLPSITAVPSELLQ